MGKTSGLGAEDLLSRPTADYRPEGRDRGSDQEASGTDYCGGDRLRKIDPDPQDVPGQDLSKSIGPGKNTGFPLPI